MSPTSNKTSLHLPLPLNKRNFLLLKAQFARKYTQWEFRRYTPIFNKQFWQQNLATSEILVRCILLTASFLSSRKQCEYETTQKKNHPMVVTSLVKHTLPPFPHPETSRIYLTPPSLPLPHLGRLLGTSFMDKPLSLQLILLSVFTSWNSENKRTYTAQVRLHCVLLKKIISV